MYRRNQKCLKISETPQPYRSHGTRLSWPLQSHATKEHSELDMLNVVGIVSVLNFAFFYRKQPNLNRTIFQGPQKFFLPLTMIQFLKNKFCTGPKCTTLIYFSFYENVYQHRAWTLRSNGPISIVEQTRLSAFIRRRHNKLYCTRWPIKMSCVRADLRFSYIWVWHWKSDGGI